MHKKLIGLIIILVIVVFVIGYFAPLYKSKTAEIACRRAGGGWAPVGPIEYALIGCDGKRLTSDSPLIERGFDKSGYTCYCHTPNTCWNGKECVEIPK